MPRRLIQLFAGLVLYGVSDSMLLLAGLGVDPWDVLHQGLARRTGIPVGTWAIIAGAVVLLLWIPLRQRPGLGTLCNVVLIGTVIDAVLAVVTPPRSLPVQAAVMVAGVVLNGVATGLYIGAGLGPGPRDGLMTGFAARGHSLRVVRTCIEATVLLAGWLLGGTVGVGTVVYAACIGPLAHVFVPLFSRRAAGPAPASRSAEPSAQSGDGSAGPRPPGSMAVAEPPPLEGSEMTRTPVVFIHGLWLHSTSWAPWVELFSQAGYDPIAPGWPGDPDTVAAARANPDSIADHGIDDVTEHYERIIDALPARPILIGHSFGGMIAEKLLGLDYGAAAIGIDAAQIKGVLPLPLSALHSTLPVFKNPANKHRAVSLTAEQFRYSFGNAVSPEESDELYERWTIPAPGKPLFEAAAANFSLHSPAKVNTENQGRGPLLLIMGGQDHTVPEVITKATVKQYRHSSAVTDLEEFGDRGHSLTIDSGWREVADACLAWLGKHGL